MANRAALDGRICMIRRRLHYLYLSRVDTPVQISTDPIPLLDTALNLDATAQNYANKRTIYTNIECNQLHSYQLVLYAI